MYSYLSGMNSTRKRYHCTQKNWIYLKFLRNIRSASVIKIFFSDSPQTFSDNPPQCTKNIPQQHSNTMSSICKNVKHIELRRIHHHLETSSLFFTFEYKNKHNLYLKSQTWSLVWQITIRRGTISLALYERHTCCVIFS